MNHPIAGPIFSGPHEQPFICETETFKTPSGDTLGKPLDADCSIARRVDYYYRSTAGGDLKPFTPSSRPADLAQTTTLEGKHGALHRADRDRHDQPRDLSDGDASQSRRSSGRRSVDEAVGWNQRLIYTHGGGCTSGWYRQGTTTGGVDDDVMLRQGYAVASASLNVFGNNCNDLLGVRDDDDGEGAVHRSVRTAEVHDRLGMLGRVVSATADRRQLSRGCSTASCRAAPSRTSASARFRPLPTRVCSTTTSASPATAFSDEQKRAVTGFLNLATMVNVDKGAAGRIQVSEFCPPVLPLALRYHPANNPKGARCDVYDHTVNVYGRDPKTGFARRPLDNVGVQYGLGGTQCRNHQQGTVPRLERANRRLRQRRQRRRRAVRSGIWPPFVRRIARAG